MVLTKQREKQWTITVLTRWEGVSFCWKDSTQTKQTERELVKHRSKPTLQAASRPLFVRIFLWNSPALETIFGSNVRRDNPGLRPMSGIRQLLPVSKQTLSHSAHRPNVVVATYRGSPWDCSRTDIPILLPLSSYPTGPCKGEGK